MKIVEITIKTKDPKKVVDIAASRSFIKSCKQIDNSEYVQVCFYSSSMQDKLQYRSFDLKTLICLSNVFDTLVRVENWERPNVTLVSDVNQDVIEAQKEFFCPKRILEEIMMMDDIFKSTHSMRDFLGFVLQCQKHIKANANLYFNRVLYVIYGVELHLDMFNILLGVYYGFDSEWYKAPIPNVRQYGDAA